MFPDVLKTKTKSTNTFTDKPKSIFSFLQGPKPRDLETNFPVVVECYDVAMDALRGHVPGTEEF